MALTKYSEVQLVNMSMLEVAHLILIEQKVELSFIELFDKVSEVKQFSSSQKDTLLSRFYTDLNIDGRFSTIGSNKWGLKRWYRVEQTTEKALAASRKKEANDLEESLSNEEDSYDEDETLHDELDEVIEEDDGESAEAEVI